MLKIGIFVFCLIFCEALALDDKSNIKILMRNEEDDVGISNDENPKFFVIPGYIY